MPLVRGRTARSPIFSASVGWFSISRILDMAPKGEDAHIPATEAALEVSNAALHTEGDEDFSAVVRFMEALNAESRVARAVLDGFGQVKR